MNISRHLGYLIVTFSVASNGLSQVPFQVEGKFKPPVETTVSICKPVSGAFNNALPDTKNEVETQSGSFNISTVIDKPGFVKLQGKGMPKTYFYSEPGGHVEVSIVKDNTGKVKVMYSGDNAPANNLLVSNAPLDNHKFLQYQLPELFQAATAEQLMASVAHALEEGTKPFGSMLAKKKITQNCYDAMMRETEQTIVYWINTYLKNFLMPDRELPQVSKLSRDEVNKLANLLYTQYDPFDSRYQVATKTYDNQLIKASLIESGVIPGRSDVTPTWAPFADNLNMIVSRLPAVDHAPDPVQMTFMGTSLMSALAFKAMDDKQFLDVFNVYYEKFPQSPFIPVITEQLGTRPAVEMDVATDAEDDLYYLLNKTDSLTETRSRIVDVNSIQELIQKEFAGRAVFVDFWATWCSPCIAEFQHEPALRKFLKQKNVATLYVSIDNDNAVKRWEKAVNKYHLSGYHHHANKEFRTNLEQLFSGIPRYMFFDSKGVLRDNALPKPGSKSELYQRISDLLEGQ